MRNLHLHNGLDLANKNSFFNNYTVDIFLFVTAIILLVVTIIVIHSKYTELKSLVTSLALQEIKEICMVAKHEYMSL